MDHDIAWVCRRFGIDPERLERDERLKSLAALKLRLDERIKDARRKGGKLDSRFAKQKQRKSKTKSELLARIPARFGFEQAELNTPMRHLIGGLANSMIFLALLRPTKPSAKLPNGGHPLSSA